MPRKKLTVKRKGYHRKGYYIRRNGKRIYIPPTYIKPTTYKIKDRGALGKGKKKIPIKPNKALSSLGYSLSKSAKARHRALDKAVRLYGAKKVWHRLLALRNVREKAGIPGASPPPASTRIGKEWRIINSDMKYIKEKYQPNLTPVAAIRARKRR